MQILSNLLKTDLFMLMFLTTLYYYSLAYLNRKHAIATRNHIFCLCLLLLLNISKQKNILSSFFSHQQKYVKANSKLLFLFRIRLSKQFLQKIIFGKIPRFAIFRSKLVDNLSYLSKYIRHL